MDSIPADDPRHPAYFRVIDRPIFRLVAVPPGVAEPEVRLVDGATGRVEVAAGVPMILRGIPAQIHEPEHGN